MLVNVSILRAPSALAQCRLTSRRRAATRSPNSAGLLFSGVSGWAKTVSMDSFFSPVIAIRLSNASYPVRVANSRSNSSSNRFAIAGVGPPRYFWNSP